jgi:hypothetical protein
MAEKKFALVFWSNDQQYSVVAYEDIVGEAKLGEILPVAWRIRKKSKRAGMKQKYFNYPVSLYFIVVFYCNFLKLHTYIIHTGNIVLTLGTV